MQQPGPRNVVFGKGSKRSSRVMSLHADIALPARDRRRLERLARTILRPPICLERLEAQPNGRLTYKLKTQWRDGTTHVLMERHELLERLAPTRKPSLPPPTAAGKPSSLSRNLGPLCQRKGPCGARHAPRGEQGFSGRRGKPGSSLCDRPDPDVSAARG